MEVVPCLGRRPVVDVVDTLHPLRETAPDVNGDLGLGTHYPLDPGSWGLREGPFRSGSGVPGATDSV